jgi:regulator of RNase E activity RraA
MTGQPVTGDAGLAARLARLDTCTLSDALDVLGMEGVVSGLVPLWEGARLAGPAVTVKLAPGSPGTGQTRVHLVTAVLGHGYETMTSGRRPSTVPAGGEDGRP